MSRKILFRYERKILLDIFVVVSDADPTLGKGCLIVRSLSSALNYPLCVVVAIKEIHD